MSNINKYMRNIIRGIFVTVLIILLIPFIFILIILALLWEIGKKKTNRKINPIGIFLEKLQDKLL